MFPGVYMIEGMAQTAGVICIRSGKVPTSRTPTVYFMTIDKAKFRKPVIPGDTIEYHMTKIASAGTCGGIAARRASAARWWPKPKSAPCSAPGTPVITRNNS